MTTEQKQAYLEKMRRDRGYVLDMHKTLVTADFDWVKAYDPFVHATYTKQRTLDRKTKELIQVAVETALKAEADQIGEHIRVAMEHGASSQEVLEAMQCVVMPMGMLAFRRGLQAWVAETGLEPLEPVSSKD